MAKRSIFLIALFVAFGNLQVVNAQTSLDYYKTLFDSWALQIDVLSQEKAELDKPATKKDLQILVQILGGDETDQKLEENNIVNTSKTERYLLVLASQFQTTPQINDRITDYQNVIVICDSLEAISLPQHISCAPNSISFTDQNPNESSVSRNVLDTIQPVDVGGVNYYLLPQILLITPQYQKNLGDYFRAISRAQASAIVTDKRRTAQTAEPDLFKNFKDSSILEITGYALILITIIIALRKPIIMLIHNPRRLLEKDTYTNQMQRILSFLAKNSGALCFVFLALIIFYIPILYALYTKAQILGNPSYPIKYLTTTLNPLNIPNYLTSQNLFRIGLLFYHYLLLFFGLLLVFPSVVTFSTSYTRKIKSTKLNTDLVKWMIPVIIVVNCLLLAFLEVKVLVGLLSFSLVILLAMLGYIKGQRIDYTNLFSHKQRRWVISVMLGALVLNVAYPLYQKHQPIEYTYEPLIGIKDNVIASPYSKKWGKKKLFEPYYYNGDSMVYADAYLIYSPGAKQIVNKPLDNFSNTGSFTIVSRKADRVFETIFRVPELLNYVTTTEFSPVFTISPISSIAVNSSALGIQITFNCNLAPPPAAVKLEVTTLDKFVQNYSSKADDTVLINPISAESTDIMKFPGCKTETGLETFQVPLDAESIPQDFALFRINGLDPKYLAGLKVSVEGRELPVLFINKEVLNELQYKILYSSPNPASRITNYFTEEKKGFQFDIVPDAQGFNLSAPINTLMKKGVLQNPFIIWTNKPNEIIQSL